MTEQDKDKGNSGVLSRLDILTAAGEFDIESIQSITAAHKDLTDISALSECRNVMRINLSHNKLSTLHSLAFCQAIVYLNVTSNKLTNIDCLSKLGNLEELTAAGNRIGSLDRLQCLSNLQHLQKLRLLDRISNLSNPVCRQPDYHTSVLKILPQLFVFDGQRVKGRGSKFYEMCQELDKQLATRQHAVSCPCTNCENEGGSFTDAGRTFGPVPVVPPSGPWIPTTDPWIKPGVFAPALTDRKGAEAIHEFGKVLSECKKLDEEVAEKIEAFDAKLNKT